MLPLPAPMLPTVEVDEEELSLPQFELVNISTQHCKDMFKTGG